MQAVFRLVVYDRPRPVDDLRGYFLAAADGHPMEIMDMSFALQALGAEYALFKLLFPKTSLVAISVVAAVIHNLVQNLVFCLVTQTPEALTYLPYLAVTGALAGVIVGLTCWSSLKILPAKYFSR